MAQDSITTTELAQATGIPYRTVAKMCATGRIAAEKDSAGEYRISVAEAERIRTEVCERALHSLQRALVRST